MPTLGPFQLEHPFVLAPMAGITNSPYRRLMRKLGSALVVSELVSATGMEYASQRTLDLLKFHEEERPIGLQIFGEDGDMLSRASQVIEKLGADFVDLNLGCPVPKIVKKGGGAALCRNPAELGRILTQMKKSIKIPLAIKIRTGWDSESRNALEVVRVAEESGVAWVAIHGRTRAQGYSGLADWDFIGDIKAKSRIPIVGNGDVATAQDAMHKLTTYGVDAIWIARAALRNPFLFEQCRARYLGLPEPAVTPERYLGIMDDQRRYLEEVYKPNTAMLHGKKFLSWYASGFPGCHEFRRGVFGIKDTEELWSAGRQFFESSVRDRDLSFLSQPFLMGGHG